MKLRYKTILVLAAITIFIILLLGFFVKIPMIGNASLQFIEYEQYLTLKKSNNIDLVKNQTISIEYENQKTKCKITKIFSNEKYWTFQIDKFLFFNDEILIKDINVILENTYLFSYLFSYII